MDAGAIDGRLCANPMARCHAPNFSAAYALAFCAGVYFPRRLAWWLPLSTLFVTDVVMNVFYYQVPPIDDRMAGDYYLAYAAAIFLGQRFRPSASLGATGGRRISRCSAFLLRDQLRVLDDRSGLSEVVLGLDSSVDRGHTWLAAYLGILS